MEHLLQRMPKTELHLHLEGTLEPALAFALAERNGVRVGSPDFPWNTVEELSKAYDFENLASFLDVYYKVSVVLKTRQDFKDLTNAYCKRALENGVVHAELFFDPQSHTSRGISFVDVAAGIFDGLEEAKCQGLSAFLIACLLRDAPPGTPEDAFDIHQGVDGMVKATGWSTVKSVVEYNKQTHAPERRIIGLGLDSNEVGYPPSLFVSHFRYAAAGGLRLTAHAGEEGPPAYMWQCIRDLGVSRIDHGIRATEDEALMAHLVSTQLPLTVCPLSNFRLGATPDPAEHPILHLIDRGVNACVNSDDPAYFGGYMVQNLLAMQKWFGEALTRERLHQLCINGFKCTWLDQVTIDCHVAACDAFFESA